MAFVTTEDGAIDSPRVPWWAHTYGRKAEGAQGRQWSLNVKQKGYNEGEAEQRRPIGWDIAINHGTVWRLV